MLLIKIGGGKQINWDFIAEDIASLINKGEKIIVVHGASAYRDEVAIQMGVPTKTVTSPSGISSVYTDQNAIDIFLMVYAGLINKKIVAVLRKHDINAVGLSGVDGGLWEAQKKGDLYVKDNDKIKLLRGNLTGKVIAVNGDLLTILIEHGYVPVLCPPAITPEYEIVNTDNDLATAFIAEQMKIKKIVSLFEAPGLLADVNKANSVIPVIKKEELENFLNVAKTRMKKKILGAKKSFEMGVEKIFWGDGRIKNPVISAMRGKGTVIK